MATLNRPDRLQLDAFSDTTTRLGTSYSRFTNTFKNPLLGVKGVQLVNANFVNSSYQLNDYNGQLMFWYYIKNNTSSFPTIGSLACVRLLPSWFVPRAGITTFVRNQYFNTGTELATALNLAASTGGDDPGSNPWWQANKIVFSFDTATRKFSITAASAGFYISPAAPDDPVVLNALRGTTYPTNRIKMPGFNTPDSPATPLQPYKEGMSMTPRLGFTLSYNGRGPWWSSTSVIGIANFSGTPIPYPDPCIADCPPILMGVQNVGVYLSCSTGGGVDSLGRKNLIASIPIENAPFCVNSYTTNSVEVPSLSTPNEIYEITVELVDETGTPFQICNNMNTQIGLALYY